MFLSYLASRAYVARKIALVPFGPKMGNRPPIIVSALDGRQFGPLEVAWRAQEAQHFCATPLQNGIGIYRSGLARGRPSYYIGESSSLLESH